MDLVAAVEEEEGDVGSGFDRRIALSLSVSRGC